MNSFLIFLIILACASTVEAVCYAPAQNDAACMQKHGTYGYGCADDKNCYWTGANLYSDYDGGSCRAVQTCTAATVVQCQAPAQADAACMQKHGTYGYGCADDKNCYWTGSDFYGEGTCLAKETCVDNGVSTLSKGEKVQTGLLVVVIALLALIAVYMVLLAKSIIPTKDAAADVEGQDQPTTADADEQEDQLSEKRRWFGCCKKKAAEVTQEEAEEGVLDGNENTVDTRDDEKKAPGDNQDEQV
jgi:cell division protein FtsL